MCVWCSGEGEEIVKLSRKSKGCVYGILVKVRK